jgi:polycomb protein EED
MSAQTDVNREFEIPKLRKIIRTTSDNPDSEQNAFWDAKFYPFNRSPEAPYIFSISNVKNIMVCRLMPEKGSEVESLRVFSLDKDDRFTEHHCSSTWAYIDPERPLLLSAGDSGVIAVFDVIAGGLKTSLLGHGQGTINDLATNPKYPWIVASASQDTSIRIWDLRRWDQKHTTPCVVICGHGGGHKESLLSVSWHDSGRYLISGAHDNKICVWTIPDLSPDSHFWKEISPAQRKCSQDEVRVIVYPHFSTVAIHANFVDCVRFYGDLIISKAAEEHRIVLWSMTGFNSRLEPPEPILAPKTGEHLETRNGFMKRLDVDQKTGVQTITVQEAYSETAPYKRLLEFSSPATGTFFIRFDILKPSILHPDLHPMLAIGNTISQVFFWDLESIEIGYHPSTKQKKRIPPPPPKKKGIATRINKFHPAPTPPFSSFPSTPAPGPASTILSSPSRSRDSRERSNSLQYSSHQHEPTYPPDVPNSSSRTSTPLSETPLPVPNFPVLPFPDPSTPHFPPPPDRTAFPLHSPHQHRHKPVETVKLDFPQRSFCARGVGWSLDGKYCVVAGETTELVVRGETRSGSWNGDGQANVHGSWDGTAGKTMMRELTEEVGRMGNQSQSQGQGRKTGASGGGGGKGRTGREEEWVKVGAACVLERWVD